MAAQGEVYRTPGDYIGKAADYREGDGTYVRGHSLCSSKLGLQQLRAGIDSYDKRPEVEVVRNRPQSAIPHAGATVVAKVMKVNPRMAVVDILCVGQKAASGHFSGIIRQQDVRATEIDKVDLYLCFRPGDLVRAEVLSLGDARSYYLSTAKNELGVVYAKSITGSAMVAVSWQEMQCLVSGQKEPRKVAKLQ